MVFELEDVKPAKVEKVVLTQIEIELAVVKRAAKSSEITVSETCPYFPSVNSPLSLISENPRSAIAVVAGDLIRANAPKSMIKCYRDTAEKAKDYDEVVTISKRWVVIS